MIKMFQTPLIEMFATDFSGLICFIPSISTFNKKTIIQLCFKTRQVIRLRGLGSRTRNYGRCPKPGKKRWGHGNLLIEMF